MAPIPPSQSRKNAKSAEIQRALTHRARIRKAYFKLLDKDDSKGPTAGPTETYGAEADQRDGENSTQQVDGDKVEGQENDKGDVSKRPHKPPMTYSERMKLIRERKQSRIEEKKQNVIYQRQQRASKAETRERHKKQMTKYTNRGQPLMNGRINRLLDKIKDGQ